MQQSCFPRRNLLSKATIRLRFFLDGVEDIGASQQPSNEGRATHKSYCKRVEAPLTASMGSDSTDSIDSTENKDARDNEVTEEGWCCLSPCVVVPSALLPRELCQIRSKDSHFVQYNTTNIHTNTHTNTNASLSLYLSLIFILSAFYVLHHSLSLPCFPPSSSRRQRRQRRRRRQWRP